MLILDVDGILTDCKIWMDSGGEWRRRFCVKDGAGIKRLIDSGYQIAIITGSKAEDIRKRVSVLGIHYLFEGRVDKNKAYQELKDQSGIRDEEAAYMGDDYFDIPVLKSVAFSATVPEAMEEVKSEVQYITQKHGGDGAVREICDFIWRYGAYSKQ